MCAMGHPAVGSGMSTRFSGERSLALSAMNSTPAKTRVAHESSLALRAR